MCEKKIKVLFFDGEALSLEGLRRGLHVMRKEWTMIFTSQFDQAEQLVAALKIDVIVADISGRAAPGIKLLEQAKKNLPGVIRIGLSAETNENDLAKTIRFTHRFLAKPFAIDDLKNIIERSIILRNRLNNPALETIVARVEKLPSVPRVYRELTQIMSGDDFSINQIAQIIEKDINMTSQILKIVNSAYFGLFKNITSVQRAVNLLGVNLIKNLILGLNIFKGLEYPQKFRPLIERIWPHSLKVAAILQHIVNAEKIGNLCESAFSLGILHDVGKIIFLLAFGDKYYRLTEKATKENIAVYLLEKEQYGMNHGEVGAYLLGLWGLPEMLVQAVAESHDRLADYNEKHFELFALQVADLLEHTHGQPGLSDWDERFLPEALQGLEDRGKSTLWKKIARQVLLRK